jgi:hypothetical protein
MRNLIFCLSFLWSLSAFAESKVISFPEQLNTSCRKGDAKLFDECSDQLELLSKAKARAKADNKVLLVAYGAEWCIWCHVLVDHINGKFGEFEYTYAGSETPDDKQIIAMSENAEANVSAPAHQLQEYVSKNFIILHVDSMYAPNGEEVIRQTGALEHYDGGLPFVFTVDVQGTFAKELVHDVVEVRRDGWFDQYRGYDRSKLLLSLKEMELAARKQ